MTGRTIVVIDDVVTSGATMLGCLDVIRRSYPEVEVLFYALASTV